MAAVNDAYVEWRDANGNVVYTVSAYTSDPSVQPGQTTTISMLYDPSVIPTSAVDYLWHWLYKWACPPLQEPVYATSWGWSQAPGATTFEYHADVCAILPGWWAPSVTFTGYNGYGQVVEYKSTGTADWLSNFGCHHYFNNHDTNWQLQDGRLTLHAVGVQAAQVEGPTITGRSEPSKVK